MFFLLRADYFHFVTIGIDISSWLKLPWREGQCTPTRCRLGDVCVYNLHNPPNDTLTGLLLIIMGLVFTGS